LKDNDGYGSTVLFCRYLNENPEYAKQYNDLKIELALKYPDDRLAYTEAKDDFIRNIIALAKGGFHAENVLKMNLNAIIQIMRYCKDIADAVLRFGNSYEALINNKYYKNAVSMCVFQIGRLSVRLSEDFKVKYNGVLYHEIKVMRNIIAHEYQNIKIDELWVIISERVPELCRYCEKILRENNIEEQME
jgi:uncharacterized protein with HEPN domain